MILCSGSLSYFNMPTQRHVHTYTHTHTIHHTLQFWYGLLLLMACTCSSLWRTSFGYWSHFAHMQRELKVPTTWQLSPTESLSHCLTGAETWKPTCSIQHRAPLQNHAGPGTLTNIRPYFDYILSCFSPHSFPSFLVWKRCISESLAHKSSPLCLFLENKT